MSSAAILDRLRAAGVTVRPDPEHCDRLKLAPADPGLAGTGEAEQARAAGCTAGASPTHPGVIERMGRIPA